MKRREGNAVMEKRREPFKAPKKAAIFAAGLVFAVAVLAAAMLFSASAVAKRTSIGEEKAENFAFADLGIDPLSAEGLRTRFDFKQGQFVYQVCFTADGTEYEYWIKASDGSVVKKGADLVAKGDELGEGTAPITLDRAKEIALSDAGVKRSEAVFTKAKLEVEDAGSVYDIEFHAGDVEYEYEILEHTGAIYSKSKETYLAGGADAPEGKTQEEGASDGAGASGENIQGASDGAGASGKNIQGNGMAGGIEDSGKQVQGGSAPDGAGTPGKQVQGCSASEIGRAHV